jgi:hypothetical protein
MGIVPRNQLMPIPINDPVLLERLRQAADGEELTTPDGEPIGLFTTGLFRLPPGVQSPFTDAERTEFRKQRDGRKLTDFLRELEAGEGQ